MSPSTKKIKIPTACIAHSVFCANFGPGRTGGGFVGGGSGFNTKTLDSYVACIRKNGYAAMPAPNTSGKGGIFPSSVQSNADFKKANGKCESILRGAFTRPSGAPPGTAGGGASTTTSS